MGYTGRILVARTGPFPGALFEEERVGGWRWIQLDGDAPGALTDLVTATGTPAISAYVLDSDVADVQALTPGGRRWRTYLNPQVAERFGAPPLDMTPDEVVGAALSWSAEAGLTADGEAVREALVTQYVEAEEAFEELITALGVA